MLDDLAAARQAVVSHVSSNYRHLYASGRYDDHVAIKAAVECIKTERARALEIVEAVRTSPYWSGREADNICEAIVNEIKGIAP